MIDADHLYLDRGQLAARGWTKTLTARFLPNPDRWASVNHWQNYTGKAAYFVEKVIAAEQLSEFKKAFAASISRRNLNLGQIDAAMQERARVEAMYRGWLKTVTSKDVQRILALNAAAAAFESVGAWGCRRPHK